MDPSKLYYLASPYSHPDPEVMRERFEKVVMCAANLKDTLDLTLIEPIACGHAKATMVGTRSDFEYWKKSCEIYIQRSDGIIVLMLEGWEISGGVQYEIEYAKSQEKEIIYITEAEYC